MKIEFIVYGTPQPQGSARAFIPKGWKRPVITSDNSKLKSWRQELAKAAMLACCEVPDEHEHQFPLHAKIPVQVALTFFFAAPKHSKALLKTTRPDVDKLMRAALDGMTGIIYADDSQVCHAQISKRFGLPERVEIFVCPA